MYNTILVTLDGTPTDRAIIEHIKQLAKLAHSRLVLLHVADGWAARTYGPDAVSPEIAEDTAYLEKVRAEFQAVGIPAEAELAYMAMKQTAMRALSTARVVLPNIVAAISGLSSADLSTSPVTIPQIAPAALVKINKILRSPKIAHIRGRSPRLSNRTVS